MANRYVAYGYEITDGRIATIERERNCSQYLRNVHEWTWNGGNSQQNESSRDII